MVIEALSPANAANEIPALAAMLTDAVRHGASIGFLWPLEPDEVEAYWRKVIADLVGGYRTILVARETAGGPIVGTAQLACESRRNGRHRAEVQKVMVLSTHRRRRIASALMVRLEAIARERGLRLLFLDTSEGHGGASDFYVTLGYTHCGGVPGYALDPDGTPANNAIFYKTLA